MRKHRAGFTLVEVSLFLAITALLFMSVTVGVQNSIYQQRYNEAVQSFADFLGNTYSEVMNVQSSGYGRTKKAIYGKLVVFPDNSAGEGEGEEDDGQVIYVYDVVGDAGDDKKLANAGTKELLAEVGADIVMEDEDGFVPVGVTDEYRPRWGSRIQKKDSFEDYSGSLLIVRNPKSGTVQTYVSATPITIDADGNTSAVFKDVLNSDFAFGEVDFCVNPDGVMASDRRADVRLMNEARNRSGVEIMPLDDPVKNVCNMVEKE